MEDTRRNQIIDIVERELIGPDPVPDLEIAIQKNGQEILLTDPPLKRYLAGILFPRGSPEGLADSAVDGNEDGTEENFADEGELAGTEEKAQDPGPPDDQVHLIRTGSRSGDLEEAEEMINCSNAFNPSAFSLTAAVYTGDTLTIAISALRLSGPTMTTR